MTQSSFVTNSIAINGPATAVWNVLVSPEKTKQYMFGCEAISDWNPGSELLWKGQADGKEVTFVRGYVICVEPEKHLEYTTFDPNDTSIQDIPENYLQVTYDLKEENGQTVLTASQGDFSKVAKGGERYQEVYNGGVGWTPMLQKIKELVESGTVHK
ncbi:SRPBCC domain-containing protein [Dyadobacter chenhuakuii]|uniref:SRPBCC domain-containing protein n=1 Tax=Dyadobacter chenhuakuii TaxID=2909339 RepID=A0A9X1QA04_9BACT|nr:SRPBCC domain-containing protein [Dyadobacter chenhuakuii]MCF2496677.1 SRPBCC domain-containing protein [Dyadobacter chenhuakuii]